MVGVNSIFQESVFSFLAILSDTNSNMLVIICCIIFMYYFTTFRSAGISIYLI